MADQSSTPPEPRATPRPRPRVVEPVTPVSTWMDADDVADHQAWERAHSAHLAERPPHY